MVLPLDQRGPLTGSPTAAATTVILASYVTTARRSAPTAQAVARWPGPWRDGWRRGSAAGCQEPARQEPEPRGPPLPGSPRRTAGGRQTRARRTI